MSQLIHFYRVSDPFGEFSNFAPYPIEVGGITWPTSEHYFQGQKFAGTHHADEIRAVLSPTVAAQMGRDRHRPLRTDWEQVKDDVMRSALFAKFTQHEKLRRLLIGTGDAELVEHAKSDSYWGDGGDGSGKNALGKLLMELRQVLSTATTDA